jgi:TRAP-type C4-dicarboxylate transport system substrate-binding protein
MKLTTFLASAAFALVMGGAAHAQDPIVLKFSADSPSTGNVCSGGYMDAWAKKIEEDSAGKLKIELVCDGLLGKVGDNVNRVAAGVADIGWDLPLAYGKRFAPLGVIGVPGLYADAEVAGGALWKLQEAGKTGVKFEDVKLLWIQGVPNTAYYLKAKPASHTDLTGLKIAMGSKMRATMINAMGGVPIQLGPPEYYQAIQKGAADGAQSTVGAIGAYKLQELLHYYVYGPFGGGFTFIVMNPNSYAKLPDDLKKVIDDNSGYMMSRKASAFLRDWEDKFLKEKMLSIAGNERVDLTADEVAAWQKAFAAAEGDWVGSVEGGPAILADFKAALAAEPAGASN